MTNDKFQINELFNLYKKELIEWNKKLNLTAITDPKEIEVKHFEDSLSVLQAIKLTDQSVVDIGTGAGFPGIPLKIVCPKIKLTLIEATKKKIEFLKHLVALLDLQDVEIIWGRAEEIAKKRREQFDLALSRAVADLSVLVEYCLPLLKVGGLLVAFKNPGVEAEAEKAKKAMAILGGDLKVIKPINLAGGAILRTLVIIEKRSPTPPQFPRRPGLAKKKPL